MKADLNTAIMIVGFLILWVIMIVGFQLLCWSNMRNLKYLVAFIKSVDDKLEEINQTLDKLEEINETLTADPEPDHLGAGIHLIRSSRTRKLR